MAETKSKLESIDREFTSVTITDEGERPTQYRIYCFGESFKNPEEVLTAGALNLNGHSFSTSGFDLGEYKRPVRVVREEGSRYVNLVIGPNEE